MENDNDLLTTQQAAAYLKCSRSLIYTLMRTRQIAFQKIGSRTYIPIQTLNDYRDRNYSEVLIGVESEEPHGR